MTVIARAGESSTPAPVDEESRSLRAFQLLALLFVLAYVVCPYWSLAPSGPLRVALLVVTVLAGLVWAKLASGPVVWHRPSRREAIALAAAVLGVTVLSWRALGVDVPWLGDEDHHLELAWSFVQAVRTLGPRLWALTLAGLAGAIVLAVLSRRGDGPEIRWRWLPPSRWLATGAVLAVAGVAGAVFLALRPDWVAMLARYPGLVDVAASAVPALLVPFSKAFHEPAYRLVPLLAAALLAWSCARLPHGVTGADRVLVALAVATTPLVWSYSSTLYLELPAVLLMTLVCANAERLLVAPPAELVKEPSWYALLAVGFVKETVAPFLAVFVGLRFLSWLGRRERGGTPWPELRVAGVVLFPLAVFLAYRFRFLVGSRHYGAEPGNLLDGAAYATLARSYLAQIGPALLVLALLGIGSGLALRRFGRVTFLLAAGLADVVFHLVDRREYVGYSRFSLFVLPPILAAAADGLGALGRYRPALVTGGLVVAVLQNAGLSPLHADGTKGPAWGWRTPVRTYAGAIPGREPGPALRTLVPLEPERYYPYRPALRAVREREGSGAGFTLLSGLDYPYRYWLYLGWRGPIRMDEGSAADPRGDDRARLEAVLARAAARGAGAVLFHVEGAGPVPLAGASGFVLSRRFTNSQHELLLFERRN